jgi:hypothetical protein
MKITNRLGLPAPIVAAVTNDSYTKGDADYSVTELITPPQIVRLRQQYADQLEEDVSDRIWSLLGQAVHAIIERAGDHFDTLSEVTLYSNYDGVTIKGQADHVGLASGTLYDFKITTAWKVLNEVVPDEWVQQTNIYRRMFARERGVILNQIFVIAILRDWSKREAERRPDYPQAQVVLMPIQVWSDLEADAFIQERIALHQLDPAPECSTADTWTKPTKYALMKAGRKSAVRLYATAHEAREEASRLGQSYSVEYRAGQAVRCESYCPASQFCEQWKNNPLNYSRGDFIDNAFQKAAADLLDVQ